jgi:amino-acid N-acetyltransferase
MMTHTRAAILPDVKTIHSIIRPYADDGVLLPRDIPELCENVRDFVVAEQKTSGLENCVVGCGALHLYGLHLAEIRSIAVAPAHKGRGIGRLLVEALVQESRRHKIVCVCLFTRTPGFFGHMGFQIARRNELPDKIYKDCIHCPKLHDCDEIAMVMGAVPINGNGLRDPRIQIPLVTIGP